MNPHYTGVEHVMLALWGGALVIALVIIVVCWLTDKWAARGTEETGE